MSLLLGVPADENDLFDKIFAKGIIDKEMATLLKEMRGLRNILVHEYTKLDDKLVFKTLSERLIDFESFIEAVLNFTKKR